ncbi:hypothetical protein BDF19DRAFT_455403 [Syncephalis fuscata]|nr:hypothetical protein BDF19DRAFT_455403 [Syncephalis fuscata]
MPTSVQATKMPESAQLTSPPQVLAAPDSKQKRADSELIPQDTTTTPASNLATSTSTTTSTTTSTPIPSASKPTPPINASEIKPASLNPQQKLSPPSPASVPATTSIATSSSSTSSSTSTSTPAPAPTSNSAAPRSPLPQAPVQNLKPAFQREDEDEDEEDLANNKKSNSILKSDASSSKSVGVKINV